VYLQKAEDQTPPELSKFSAQACKGADIIVYEHTAGTFNVYFSILKMRFSNAWCYNVLRFY